MTLILNGTDNSATVPAVQGGTAGTTTGVYYPSTNQVALAANGTQALLANANQGIQIPNTLGVGAATPSTSGAGITFPATQSASTDANTLDDYEEGTWTPAFATAGGGLAVTYAVQSGTYTKVGKLVTVWGNIQTSTKTANGTGGLQLSGLPFTVESGPSEFGGSVGISYSWTSNPCTNILPSAGTSICILNYSVTNLGCVGADLSATSYFRFSITYRASA